MVQLIARVISYALNLFMKSTPDCQFPSGEIEGCDPESPGKKLPRLLPGIPLQKTLFVIDTSVACGLAVVIAVTSAVGVDVAVPQP